MKKTDREKLELWQGRLEDNQRRFDSQAGQMDRREQLYGGLRQLTAVTAGERRRTTPHVRNICAELIEAQVDSTVPQPKVTARREGDEAKAELIEDMLRNELDRLPFERVNDMMERTVPIQGGAAFLVEWDNGRCSPNAVGELAVSAIHPKQLVPQDGVYTDIQDMDYVVLKLPQTKQSIWRRYGVDVDPEPESEPELKGGGDARESQEMVTQYVAYYRNDRGGIGLYSWVNDQQLEDLEDYQARRLRRCACCGAAEPLEPPAEPAERTEPPLYPDMEEQPEEQSPGRTEGHICPRCGGTRWVEGQEEYEELYEPVTRSDGSVIPGSRWVEQLWENEDGTTARRMVEQPTRVPFYKPDIFPLILQKNVSRYGQLLGDSDIDKIADQQNTLNHLERKIIDKLMKSGSYITLPDEASIRVDAEDMKVIRPGNAATKAMIDVYDLQGNVQYDLVYLGQVYEEARQAIGITDSYQGRQDSTATSGVAKEFSAAQSAGRLESKRVMKNAAYATLFEAMFKFKLAYTDEPRPVMSKDIYGNARYDSFNRYDFLEQDAAGEWCWNDQFLFSTDTAASLASNRESMWQETRENLQTGAFGDPSLTETLILFWSKMELLHYPGAGETKSFLEARLEQERRAGQGNAGQARRDVGAAL
ncbi:MAG: hypothetical protein LUE91_02015 [Oscillospiraceae bacterium]|nr:hypothetical protein [Oscillospiraceae bacterium]